MRRSPRSVVAWSCAAMPSPLVTALVVFDDLATLAPPGARRSAHRVNVFVAARDLPLGATLAARDLDTVTRSESTIPPDAVASRRRRDRARRRGARPRGQRRARRVISPPATATVSTASSRSGSRGSADPARRRAPTADRRGRRRARRARPDVRSEARGRPSSRARARVLAVDAADDRRSRRSGTAGVTLLVTEDEARELAFAAANGVVTLALAPPEDCVLSTARILIAVARRGDRVERGGRRAERGQGGRARRRRRRHRVPADLVDRPPARHAGAARRRRHGRDRGRGRHLRDHDPGGRDPRRRRAVLRGACGRWPRGSSGAIPTAGVSFSRS